MAATFVRKGEKIYTSQDRQGGYRGNRVKRQRAGEVPRLQFGGCFKILEALRLSTNHKKKQSRRSGHTSAINPGKGTGRIARPWMWKRNITVPFSDRTDHMSSLHIEERSSRDNRRKKLLIAALKGTAR